MSKSTFEVYHAKEPGGGNPPRWPDDYTLVGEVQAVVLDAVFARTNSNERHWSLKPGVVCYDRNARSTMVGDVIVSRDGRVFRCEVVGWRELTARDRK